MSYIIKKNEPLVNLKLTDTGRRNLSSGSLTFTSFSLGDGEMDYSSDNFAKVNVLRPADRQHDIQYPVPSEGTNYRLPISILTSLPNEVYTAAKERGFFVYDTTGNTITVDNTLTLINNLYGVVTGTTNEINLEYGAVSSKNTLYKSTVNVGDYIFTKFNTTGYTSSYTPSLISEIGIDPTPFLMYQIQSITASGTTYNSFDLTGYTTGVTLTFGLDRNLPNFTKTNVQAQIYPGPDTINTYYDNDTPIAYWNGGLLDFTSNCTLANDDVPVWNMNILTIEEIIGLDNTIYKGKYINASRNYWGTAVNYDYFLNNLLDKVGIIHYTNNSVSNFYAEGFYKNTLTLKIPYLMWHKKQFGGVGLANDIGYTFVCDTTLKSMGVNNSINYYDLVDQEVNPTVVGKVLIDQKIILIEDQELLTALSYKSNRNWTLPKPRLTLIEPGSCPGSNTIGALQANEALHVTYIFLDTDGVTGIHCEDYTTASNIETIPKDVVFEFPKSATDITYSEFGFLKDYNAIEGYGYKVNSIVMLWQKTQVNGVPDPASWNKLNINRFMGTNGCITNVTSLCDDFTLYTESAIFSTGFDSNTYGTGSNSGYLYGLTQEEIGDVIISLNGSILKQASSVNNIGVDGEYWKYPMGVMSTPNNTSYIQFPSYLLDPGNVLQFSYLIGSSSTSATIRQDVEVPFGGVPLSNTYEDGIYIVNSRIALTLNKQPNNGVVWVFYNGQLISANNYGVYPTGTTETRRVELMFTPAADSTVSLFYLDNSGAGLNPVNTNFTAANIEKLRVNIDKSLLDASIDSNYDLNDYVELAPLANVTGHTFGDETFFYGNVSTDVKATIYKSLITCNVLPNKFINSANPTFNPNDDKTSFTEMGIYDINDELVAIGKFSEPLVRKYNSDMLIIQATIDF
jgi:hypothetical protein